MPLSRGRPLSLRRPSLLKRVSTISTCSSVAGFPMPHRGPGEDLRKRSVMPWRGAAWGFRRRRGEDEEHARVERERAQAAPAEAHGGRRGDEEARRAAKDTLSLLRVFS